MSSSAALVIAWCPKGATKCVPCLRCYSELFGKSGYFLTRGNIYVGGTVLVAGNVYKISYHLTPDDVPFGVCSPNAYLFVHGIPVDSGPTNFTCAAIATIPDGSGGWQPISCTFNCLGVVASGPCPMVSSPGEPDSCRYCVISGAIPGPHGPYFIGTGIPNPIPAAGFDLVLSFTLTNGSFDRAAWPGGNPPFVPSANIADIQLNQKIRCKTDPVITP
jgi:hypothetical protein